MISGLYQSAAGMLTQMENNQLIAENLAASANPGFRRMQATFEAYMNPLYPVTGEASEVIRQPGAKLWPPHAPTIRTTTNFSQGQILRDGNPLHLAISENGPLGNGFFAVELPNDQGIAYTRCGAFQLNTQGELVTSNGWRVMGEGGAPLVLPKPSQPIQVSDNGEISQQEITGGRQQLIIVGKFQIADFKNPTQELTWAGGSYFTPSNDSVKPETAANYILVQGSLEGSNVNQVQEMVDMIQASRAYEANQKMLQAQDGTMEQVIRQVPGR
ncbi:MAG: flagellar hook-basal body protein [Verrucomicrobia bacterium]|nr:flagellar hook-basal body protein [Verrucomicrobiota bacterium]